MGLRRLLHHHDWTRYSHVVEFTTGQVYWRLRCRCGIEGREWLVR